MDGKPLQSSHRWERMVQMPRISENEKPTAVLKAEHQVILRVLGVLRRLTGGKSARNTLDIDKLGKCVEFFRFFADACHHAKEEDLLFPVLEQRGIPREQGPIGCMLYEHTLARGFTKDMGEALEAIGRGEADGVGRFLAAAKEYIDLLTAHIEKEDTILFNMGDTVMTSDDQSELHGRFGEVGCKSFGGKKREELERMANELEAACAGA